MRASKQVRLKFKREMPKNRPLNAQLGTYIEAA